MTTTPNANYTEEDILALAPRIIGADGTDMTAPFYRSIVSDLTREAGIQVDNKRPMTKSERASIQKAFSSANSPTNSGYWNAAQIAYFDQTPLTNRMGRRKAPVPGKSVNVDTLISIPTSPANPFGRTAQGKRGSEISPKWLNKQFPLVTIGQESNATDELQAQGMDYLDALAVSGMAAFYGARRAEEINVLLSNLSNALGTPVAPTATTATTGGSIAANTYNVIVVACTHEGYLMALNNSPLALVATTQTITNVNGFIYTVNGGHSNKSAAGSVTTTGSTSIIRANTTPIPGTHWYAWYAGTAGNETLQGFTGQASITLTSLSTGNQNASAITSDVSQQLSGYAYDGLIAQAVANSSLYSYVATQGFDAQGRAKPLTGTSGGGIAEFNTMFQTVWQNWRISPDLIIMSAREMLAINALVTGTNSSNSPITQYIVDTNNNQLNAGLNVGRIMNVATNTLVPLMVHPDLPPGTIFAWTQNLGQFYQGTTVTRANEIVFDRDWTQENFPRTERSQSTGCYANESLVSKFLPGLMVITNIGDSNQA